MAQAMLSSLPSTVLTEDERDTANGLLKRLRGFRKTNERQDLYYEMKQAVRDLGIAIPPHLTDLEAALGWPAMPPDVIGERLIHDGWVTPGGVDVGIDEIVRANKLNRELSMGRNLAMRYGIAFVCVGKGGDDEPDPLITVESPMVMTATWDRRRRRVPEALLVSNDDRGKLVGATLWAGDTKIDLSYRDRKWSLENRQTHAFRRPPVVRLVNRYSTSGGRGASEITRAIRAGTDNALRTVVAMEVSRDFHAAPKFWLLGASEKSFVGPDGKSKTAWETYIGRLNAIGRDENDELPTIHQFQGASPAPFVDQLRVLAQIQSAESALPISYYGLVHDANPASADAALVGEARLNLRTEQRQDDFREDEGEAMFLGLWARDGKEPDVRPMPQYRPAATPTLAAAADATTKLVQSNVLPADSEVTLRRVGLSEQDRDQLADERRRNRSRDMLTNLSAAAAATTRMTGGGEVAVDAA